jgi:hypothetical protein
VTSRHRRRHTSSEHKQAEAAYTSRHRAAWNQMRINCSLTIGELTPCNTHNRDCQPIELYAIE